MQIQLQFIGYVLKNHKSRTIIYLVTIILAAFLELFLISSIYLLSNIFIGGTNAPNKILGIDIQINNFTEWYVIVALLATLARIAIIIYQANNIAIITNRLVSKIYSQLILSSFLDFKNKSESEFISLLTTKIQHCADNILLQASQIVSAIAISIGIISALLTISASTTLIIFASLISVYFSIMHISKFRLKAASHKLSQAHDEKNRLVLNTFNNIEALMSYGEEAQYINQLKTADAKLRNSQKIIAIFGTAPRFLIEGAILILAALPIIFNMSEDTIQPTEIAFIGAFLIGSVRLLPLINQVYAGLTSIRGSEHVARDVMQIIMQQPTRNHVIVSRPHKGNVIIQAKDIQINLNGKTIKYPNFTLIESESMAITGRSGSGKSKLLHTILGLIDIDHGILVNNCFDNEKQKNIGVGYASQTPVLISSKISDIVAAGAEYNERKIKQMLDITSLNDEIISRESIGDGGAHLSGGQLQRLALSNALYRSSSLLILDEPSSALNSDLSYKIMNKLLKYCKNNNIAVICVTHDNRIADNFDQVIELK